jgi:hypothetical protein
VDGWLGGWAAGCWRAGELAISSCRCRCRRCRCCRLRRRGSGRFQVRVIVWRWRWRWMNTLPRPSPVCHHLSERLTGSHRMNMNMNINLIHSNISSAPCLPDARLHRLTPAPPTADTLTTYPYPSLQLQLQPHLIRKLLSHGRCTV